MNGCCWLNLGFCFGSEAELLKELNSQIQSFSYNLQPIYLDYNNLVEQWKALPLNVFPLRWRQLTPARNTPHPPTSANSKPKLAQTWPFLILCLISSKQAALIFRLLQNRSWHGTLILPSSPQFSDFRFPALLIDLHSSHFSLGEAEPWLSRTNLPC